MLEFDLQGQAFCLTKPEAVGEVSVERQWQGINSTARELPSMSCTPQVLAGSIKSLNQREEDKDN